MEEEGEGEVMMGESEMVMTVLSSSVLAVPAACTAIRLRVSMRSATHGVGIRIPGDTNKTSSLYHTMTF